MVKKGRITVFIVLLWLSFAHEVLAYTTIVKSTDSNEIAKRELVKVFQQGGQITFDEGAWTINLSSGESQMLNDVTIIGANIPDDRFYRGAFEGQDSVKTVLTFTGARFSIKKGCAKFSMSNIKWVQVGFTSANKHLVEVDLNNVIFDLTNAKNAFADKQVFRCLDGIQGNIKNTTFSGSGSSAIAINRSLAEGIAPVTTRGTLIVDQCLVDPDIRYKKVGCAAFSCDGGNDEYPIPWNHGGTEYKNSLFRDCRTSSSKGENWKMINNIYEFEYSPKDAVHLEEFSNNILIKGNVFKVKGKIKQLITLGAQQGSDHIQIIDNVVEQDEDHLEVLVTAAGVSDILIKGNEIKNPGANREYVGFWSCNNLNITVEEGQPGLDPGHLDISTEECNMPFKEGVYTIKWGDEYLGAFDKSVKLVQKAQKPDGDEFKWTIKAHQIMGRNNYFSFKNAKSGRYLQVFKGPNAAQQKTMIGQPYMLFSKKVYATTLFDFDESNRVPGFAIFSKGNKYALLAGGNERRSEIIKDGDQAALYVVQDENGSDYGWSLQEASITSSGIEISKPDNRDAFSMYPNPASEKVTFVAFQLSDLLVYNMAGLQVYDHPRLKGKMDVNLSNWDTGVHFVKVSGSNKATVQKLIVR